MTSQNAKKWRRNRKKKTKNAEYIVEITSQKLILELKFS